MPGVSPAALGSQRTLAISHAMTEKMSQKNHHDSEKSSDGIIGHKHQHKHFVTTSSPLSSP